MTHGSRCKYCIRSFNETNNIVTAKHPCDINFRLYKSDFRILPFNNNTDRFSLTRTKNQFARSSYSAIWLPPSITLRRMPNDDRSLPHAPAELRIQIQKKPKKKKTIKQRIYRSPAPLLLALRDRSQQMSPIPSRRSFQPIEQRPRSICVRTKTINQGGRACRDYGISNQKFHRTNPSNLPNTRNDIDLARSSVHLSFQHASRRTRSASILNILSLSLSHSLPLSLVIPKQASEFRLFGTFNHVPGPRYGGTSDQDSPRAATESFFVEFKIKSSTVPGAPYRRA